jgi:hypothetical protein
MKSDFFAKGGGGVTNTVYIEVEVPAPTPTLGAIFGDASAGDVVYASNTTLTADVNAHNITVNAGVTVTLGWNVAASRPARMYATGTLLLTSATSYIKVDGAQGGLPSPGGVAGAGGSAGGAGSVDTTAASSGDAITFPTIGGVGGTGASGNNTFGSYSNSGVGGTLTPVTLTTITQLIDGLYGGQQIYGGSGGGGGGWTNTALGDGGAGGGGAGLAHILANAITGLGIIQAKGGSAQQSEGATSRGVSGAGGGGGIIVVCNTIVATVTLTSQPGTFIAGNGSSPTTPTAGMPGHIYLAAQDPWLPTVAGYFHPVVVT